MGPDPSEPWGWVPHPGVKRERERVDIDLFEGGLVHRSQRSRLPYQSVTSMLGYCFSISLNLTSALAAISASVPEKSVIPMSE
jgi:hypothetical protein